MLAKSAVLDLRTRGSKKGKAMRAHWATDGLIIVLQAVLSMSYAFQWVVQVLYLPVDRGYESSQLIRLEDNRRVM